MSEYQRIAFRAIDEPVSDRNLAYMRKQSTRAEITPWTFDNEYHYGDFHGNTVEMMRRGYGFHFHYANFGIRTLIFRLPRGLPDPQAAEPYLGEDELKFIPDKEGPGGLLRIDPYHEPGDLEELWDLDDFPDRLVPLRAEILARKASELGKLPNAVVLEGHTDSRPYNRSDSYTNWELSADRANAARRVMQAGGLKPSQVHGVRGYADTYPRVTTDPQDPRNRRVSVSVRPSLADERAERIINSLTEPAAPSP